MRPVGDTTPLSRRPQRANPAKELEQDPVVQEKIIRTKISLSYYAALAAADSLGGTRMNLEEYYHDNKPDYVEEIETSIEEILVGDRDRAIELAKAIHNGEDFKTLAQKYAVGFSRMLAHPLLWLTYILFPIIWLLEKFIHGLMKLLKAHHPISSVSEEELLAMVNIGKEEGVIEEHEQELYSARSV